MAKAPSLTLRRRLPAPPRGAAARLRRRFACLGALVALASPEACRDEPPPGLSRERFVDAYVAMVRTRIDSEGDTASFAAARDQALRNAGVTAREMREFVEDRRRDPEEFRAAWQAIVAKLDTLYGGVTSEPPPALRPAEQARGPAGGFAPGGAPAAAPGGASAARPADTASAIGRTAPPNVPPDTGAAGPAAPGRTAPPNIPPNIGPATGQSVPPDSTD